MNENPDESAKRGGPEQDDSSAAAQTEAGLGNTAQLQAFADLKAENSDLRDRLLRTMAEMENYRRRAEREKADVMKYAISNFAKDAVTIGDNLRRAIEAAQREPPEQNPALRTLLEGVEVTERELFKVFERHGITRFDPLGEKFDPHFHEAMVKVDVPGAPADAIVQVLQAGYKIADRVLRPAAVIVAKGGTPARAQPEPVADEPEPQPEARETGKGGAPAANQHDHDPDVVRDPTGAAKGGGQGRQKDRGGEKRMSSVTQPVTENSGPAKKDELISSFEKRLEGGN